MAQSAPIPSGYAAALADPKRQVRDARITAQRRVNTELIRQYWGTGWTILQRQDREGRGTNVIGRLASDLRAAFPEMKGLSRANLFYMRRFAGEWPVEAVVPQAVGQLPWGHVTVLLDRLDEHERRDWYASQAAAHGWSRNVLEHQIRTAAHRRLQAAPTNFPGTLPPGDSDLAQQLTKDPYVLDFLALDGDAKERQLEQALVDRIIDTLRELGEGFAFVGRQVHFNVDGDDFYVTCCSSTSNSSDTSSLNLRLAGSSQNTWDSLGSTSPSSTIASAERSMRTRSGCCWLPIRTTPSSDTPSPGSSIPWALQAMTCYHRP